MSNRVMQVLLKPGLIGLVAPLVLGLGLTRLWQELFVSQNFLIQHYADQVNQDPLRRAMVPLHETMDTILYGAAGIVWIAAIVWFFMCWFNRIAEVGAVRRLRLHWACVGALGFVGSLVAAGYFLYELRSMMALPAMAFTALFVAAFFVVIYYFATASATHKIYLPAVPLSWSRWRPW